MKSRKNYVNKIISTRKKLQKTNQKEVLKLKIAVCKLKNNFLERLNSRFKEAEENTRHVQKG